MGVQFDSCLYSLFWKFCRIYPEAQGAFQMIHRWDRSSSGVYKKLNGANVGRDQSSAGLATSHGSSKSPVSLESECERKGLLVDRHIGVLGCDGYGKLAFTWHSKAVLSEPIDELFASSSENYSNIWLMYCFLRTYLYELMGLIKGHSSREVDLLF